VNAVCIDPTLETTTRTGHVVLTTRMPPSAPALFETRVSLNGKEVCLWDCNREATAAEQHAELVAKHGGAPIEPPDGLTDAEYLKLALDCLAQTHLSRHAHVDVARRIRQDLEAQTWGSKADSDDIDGQSAVVDAHLELLARAS